ncbi:hypothetical protein NQ315_007945 [Exocentrus adspersus]|uniref:Transposase n=1 Tax=Exocentrus adspersus TaxID=1586481 RepID=A0AAV8VBG0_9CUCU|nr:hypothetical protein NQ315_007945 [Exocentrus adspersus]
MCKMPIQHVPDFIKNRMWLQLDGAPAHFSVTVRHHLNEHFPNAWIGRQEPTAWPPRSADLTPMDYFLWGVVKSNVYRVPAATREDMVERIQQSFQRISPLVLSNVRRSFRREAELCSTENGHHFEQCNRCFSVPIHWNFEKQKPD